LMFRQSSHSTNFARYKLQGAVRLIAPIAAFQPFQITDGVGAFLKQ